MMNFASKPMKYKIDMIQKLHDKLICLIFDSIAFALFICYSYIIYLMFPGEVFI